jgi:hypothetical protein
MSNRTYTSIHGSEAGPVGPGDLAGPRGPAGTTITATEDVTSGTSMGGSTSQQEEQKEKALIGYSSDGRANCMCLGVLYVNCGSNCDCCDNIPISGKEFVTRDPLGNTHCRCGDGRLYSGCDGNCDCCDEINAGRDKIAGNDPNGNPYCLCSDGNIYKDCGNNCQCCNEEGFGEGEVIKQHQQKTYNTLSCPCSTLPILNDDGKLSHCEIQSFGLKYEVTPIEIKNHLIGTLSPKLGDKWRCGNGVPCGSENLDWDSLFVVSVEEDTSNSKNSIFNSIYSTSNCYVPPSFLNDIPTEVDVNREYLKNLINTGELNNDGLRLFENAEDANQYIVSTLNRGFKEFSEFVDEDGTMKYAIGKHYPNQKLITSVSINGHDALQFSVQTDFNYTEYSNTPGKLSVSAKGGMIILKISGENKPVVDISIEDSSGCSILKRKLKNIIIDKSYILEQEVPKIVSGKTEEKYTVKIMPTASTAYYVPNGTGNNGLNIIHAGIIETSIWQHINPTISFTNSSSSIANSSTTTNTSTAQGEPNSSRNYTDLTHVMTISRSSGSDNYYVDKLQLKDLISDSSIIYRTVVENGEKQDEECRNELLLADSTSTSAANLSTALEIGMQLTGSVTKTKTVFKSVDLDEHLKEPCDDCDKELDILTNKFELENTNDLHAGMSVSGTNANGFYFASTLESVDCGKSITITDHHVIEKETTLTFSRSYTADITGIRGNIVELNDCVVFPKNTEVSISKGNKSTISGTFTFDKSGDSEITVTTNISNINFGQEDVTFTLDPDLFISKTPPISDRYIEVGKNSSVVIFMNEHVVSYNKNSLISAIVSGPFSGTLASRSDVEKLYTPNEGFTGKDKIQYTLADGEGATASATKTVYITVK